MSINITVHQNPASSTRDKLFYNEKDDFEKRRKLRLVQVSITLILSIPANVLVTCSIPFLGTPTVQGNCSQG